MGIVGRFFNFFSPKNQVELIYQSMGKQKGLLAASRAKAAMKESIDKWLWSCMVLGDKAFPALKGKKIAGKIHASGVAVLMISLAVPLLLTVRMYHRITSLGRKENQIVKKIMQENAEANEKILKEMRRMRENQSINQPQQ